VGGVGHRLHRRVHGDRGAELAGDIEAVRLEVGDDHVLEPGLLEDLHEEGAHRAGADHHRGARPDPVEEAPGREENGAQLLGHQHPVQVGAVGQRDQGGLGHSL